MSETYIETLGPPKLLVPASPRVWARSRWLKLLLVLVALLWVVGQGVSLVLQHTRLRRLLTVRIEAAMGRPVEVGSYAFSFWNGPVVEARSLAVSEDPRFGAEYFLRADSMSVRLRWRSLLRGRIEFGTVSLDRPSLNLVRNSAGDWNLAQWLPRPRTASDARVFSGPVLPAAATGFRRIEVKHGRINFKLADEKIPFAFVGVSGAVETENPGRWRLNLDAIPWRAAVVLQRAGTIHVSGDVGGTSSRLRPASLHISWTGASLSDVLRLARGDDFGVRGALSLAIDARTGAAGDAWIAQGRSELRQIHRWDLPSRPDNPPLNLTALVAWRPFTSYLDLTEATLEAPHSRLQASGRISWSREAGPAKRPASPQAAVSSAGIDAGDALAWARAFHLGIADGLAARGLLRARAAVAGWPPHLVNATVSSDGLDLSGPAMRRPVHLGGLQFRYENGAVDLLPLNVSWGPIIGAPDGSLRLETAPPRGANTTPLWRISGSARNVRDLIAGAAAFGWNLSRGWDLGGPFACDLRWPAPSARFRDTALQPAGWMEFGAPSVASGGAVLRAPFLNLPIEQIHARVELTPGFRKVQLSSAQAFGARWSGTLERRDPSAPWQFNLAADQLAAADLDRWLNPRWRQSFLDRMLPFLNSRSAVIAAPEDLRANGRISAERFTPAPLVASHLNGDLEINGRRLTVKDASAQFYGGHLTGSLDANLQAAPSYHADFSFSRVDVASLVAELPALAGISGGSGSARLSLDARGATREELADSLKCEGAARVLAPQLRRLEGASSAGVVPAADGVIRFANASAQFSCAQRKVEFQNLLLQGPDDLAEGSGTVNFTGGVDLLLRMVRLAPEAGDQRGETLRLTGTLPALQLAPAASARASRLR